MQILKFKFVSSLIWAFTFSINVFAIELSPIHKPILIEQAGNYSYELPVNIYVTTEQLDKLDRLTEDLNYAQKRYDKCQVKLAVNEVLEVKNSDWLNQWESFWFNGGVQMTNWEKSFFSDNKMEQVNIFLVESLNWTIAGQGTWGVGYGQFLRNELASDSDKLFFDQHVIGNVVIGNYRAESTLAHELGHAGLNLTHSFDSKNLMSSYKSYEPVQFKNGIAQIPNDLEFTKAQCDEGIENNPFLRPVMLDFTSVADEIGNGVVSVDGNNIENDSCVLRLLYENDKYRIEYDYMGAEDVHGLDRFDITGAMMTKKNRMERPLNLNAESKLAQKICAGGSFVGKKILELKDEKTSEVRIEGTCTVNKNQDLKVMSLSCQTK